MAVVGRVIALVVLGVCPGWAQVGGALAIDEGRGDQWGWAVDYETAGAASAAALGECGAGCSVVLTFDRCGAYAADQASASTAYGWGESYASAEGAQQRALSECGSRGGSGCVVRVWGCNGPVVEEGLGLDRASRREIQLGLRAGGFDVGGADGLFDPRTRAAIRSWQTSRGARATGYLDAAGAEALRAAGASGSAVGGVASPAAAAAPPASAQPQASEAVEVVYWQSIMNSANPAEFEAYLAQFPNGVFRTLAQARLAALRGPTGTPPAASGQRAGGVGSPGAGRPVSGAPATFGGNGATTAAGTGAGGDAGWSPGQVFRDCDDCPELVVVPAGSFRMGCVSGQNCFDDELPVHEVRVPSFALGRYEVLFEEYDRFVAATGRERPDDAGWGRGGRPVMNVPWEDATAYAEWLSAETGQQYRLPSESEWEYAARAGTTTQYSWGSDIGQNRANCGECGSRWDTEQTAPAGSFAANAWGLHDMHGNVHEWAEDCWHASYARAPADGSAWTRGGDCRRRVLRGGSWLDARASSVRRLASGSTSETASASSGFVWRGRSRLESFPLYLLHAPRAAPAATVPQGPGAVVHCCAGGPARGLPRSAISTTRTTSVPRRRHGRRPSWSTGGRRAPAAVSRGEWPVPFRIVSASRHACPPSGSGAAQTPRPVVR